MCDPALRARRAVAAGRLGGARLLDELLAVPVRERDGWVDTLLALEALPDDGADLPRGAVPYLPCDVEALLGAVQELPIRASDVFVDLGSGVGRAALLVHLLTGARAVGVELQAPLVEQARVSAAALGLDRVTFRRGDAATTEVPDGTVFFSYASLSPPALERTLAWLERLAARRRFSFCAVGFELPPRPWLVERPSPRAELSVYDAVAPRSGGTPL